MPGKNGERARLVEVCRAGRVTLIVGAGISASRGVPLWGDVVGQMMQLVTGRRRASVSLHRVREVIARELGSETADRLHLSGQPLEPQLMLEWVRHLLENPEVRARVARELPDLGAEQPPEELFVALLRRCLYDEVDEPATGDSSDALGVVTDVILAEAAAGNARRLVRVLTLNADDLLEREIARRAPDGTRPIAPVVRPSQYPAKGEPSRIPVYHLHGYLPRDADHPLGTPDRLVFTDAQFWSVTTNPMSFANRIIAHALHDSRCVFAGLSMRDVNLLRWLAVCYAEMAQDLDSRTAHDQPREALQRHFWIHAADDDPSGILRDVLARRGVRSIELGSWSSNDFAELMRDCFGRDRR